MVDLGIQISPIELKFIRSALGVSPFIKPSTRMIFLDFSTLDLYIESFFIF